MEKSSSRDKESSRKEGKRIVYLTQGRRKTTFHLEKWRNDLPHFTLCDLAFETINPAINMHCVTFCRLRRKYTIRPRAIFILAERESVRDESFIGRR